MLCDFVIAYGYVSDFLRGSSIPIPDGMLCSKELLPQLFVFTFTVFFMSVITGKGAGSCEVTSRYEISEICVR
jgi:hypothetical protein